MPAAFRLLDPQQFLVISASAARPHGTESQSLIPDLHARGCDVSAAGIACHALRSIHGWSDFVSVHDSVRVICGCQRLRMLRRACLVSCRRWRRGIACGTRRSASLRRRRCRLRSASATARSSSTTARSRSPSRRSWHGARLGCALCCLDYAMPGFQFILQHLSHEPAATNRRPAARIMTSHRSIRCYLGSLTLCILC